MNKISAPSSGGNTSCNFEAANICGFTQERNTDQFDWSRSTQSTASSGTGPSSDHTYGTKSGMLCKGISLLLLSKFEGTLILQRLG